MANEKAEFYSITGALFLSMILTVVMLFTGSFIEVILSLILVINIYSVFNRLGEQYIAKKKALEVVS